MKLPKPASPCASALKKPQLIHIPLAQIEPDPNQPRKDLGDLSDLVASIKDRGVIQPIVVSKHAPAKYQIIAGERRFTAAKRAGLPEIPALVAQVGSPKERLELQIIENLHREDLTPLEEAQSYRRLISEFGIKQTELAALLKRSDATISQTLKILELPQPTLHEIQTSEIQFTKSVLLEIANEPSPTRRQRLIHEAKRGASVKELRSLRYEKRSSTKAIKLDSATVTIRVHKLNCAPEDFQWALLEASKTLGLSALQSAAP
ncbi:MAG TPA: ParB/RepB/Spo0J family partition protein [Candidatus Sulfotelmatobacter sp.]|nr:ParB/RepB/Spo0J family partition protein [Candidatus Sulfotelmatobacter sp.]